MCGIIGYIGSGNALPFLLNGLEKMEYRGYDSSGIAVISGEKSEIDVFKKHGRIEVLKQSLKNRKDLSSTVGIGHTRWATHGEPSDINAHPHTGRSGKISIVHNGIIENYIELKSFLSERGYSFVSDTDTEIVAQLLDFYYESDVLDAVRKVISKLQGSYALGIICSNEPDKLIAVKKDSPLIVGAGENENYIASDVTALLLKTRKIYRLAENNIAVITKDSVRIVSPDEKILNPEEDFELALWDVQSTGKGEYEHFMLKEIMEQPKVIDETIYSRIKNGKVTFDDVDISDEYLKNLSKICFIGCGSAYHVGVAAKYIIEKLVKIPVEVEFASEFRYKNPIVDKNTLVIVISQSGETADSLAALKEAKSHHVKVLSIVNVIGSSIANLSDYVIYTSAGPEIAVATTKAYNAQLAVCYLFALFLSQKFETLTSDKLTRYINELLCLPSMIQDVLDKKDKIAEISKKYKDISNTFFIGRTLDYAVCLEGSLKLKEVSYVHCEAYPAGELKHGTISLIENGTLVIAVLTQETLVDKMVSNLREVKARGARVLAITSEEFAKSAHSVCEDVLIIPESLAEFSAPTAATALQILAYQFALERGCDIDKPRNLAKSVTVE